MQQSKPSLWREGGKTDKVLTDEWLVRCSDTVVNCQPLTTATLHCAEPPPKGKPAIRRTFMKMFKMTAGGGASTFKK